MNKTPDKIAQDYYNYHAKLLREFTKTSQKLFLDTSHEAEYTDRLDDLDEAILYTYQMFMLWVNIKQLIKTGEIQDNWND